MIPDDETLMAYADGELDPIAARRVEAALAADPALAERVAAHGRLRTTLADAFAPVAAEPVSDRLRALIPDNVVAFPPRSAAPPRLWMQAAAIAATLVLGVAVGTQWRGDAPVEVRGGRLVADAGLARALDSQLASARGETRMLVSFRNGAGQVCRVFAAPALDGIACREGENWALARTRAGGAARATDYRQAGSADAGLMAEAQEMMAGEPLDATGERRAAAEGWK